MKKKLAKFIRYFSLAILISPLAFLAVLSFGNFLN